MAAALVNDEWSYGVNTAVTILILIITSIYCLFLLLQRSQNKALLRKLPGFLPHPIYGDRALFLSRKYNDSSVMFLQTLIGYSTLFRKDGLFRIWIGHRPTVILFSPEALQCLLSSATEIQKGESYRLVQPWFKTGLLTSAGEKWKTRRKFLTPTFHYQILGNFVPTFDEQSKVLTEILKKSIEKEWIDICLPVTLCTLDILCETAMGVHLNSQKNNNSEYVKAVFNFLLIFAERRNKPWLWNDKILSMTKLGKKFEETLKTLTEFTKKAVKERKLEFLHEVKNKDSALTKNRNSSEEKIRMTLMDLLLTHYFNGLLTESDICEEIDTFMFAGHDTTAVSISWTLYNLGLHPTVQQRVYEELSHIFNEDAQRAMTLEDLRKMKYLECVIKESLRLYPSAPMVVRNLKKDMQISEFTIPRGTNVAAFIYGVHHDPDLYPNPDTFDPDRFLPENCVGRHPYAFIPFSAGARNCIGQKFALFEEKVVVANVIRNFVIKSLDPPDKVKLGILILLKPNGHLRLNVRKRVAQHFANHFDEV